MWHSRKNRRILTLTLIAILFFSYFALYQNARGIDTVSSTITTEGTIARAVPITRVQGPCSGTTNTSTLTVTMTNTPTSGDLLVMCIGASVYPSVDVASISETGVTWTQQVQSYYGSQGTCECEIWAGVVGSGASKTITVTYSGTCTGTAYACEYSGIMMPNYLDQTATNVNLGGSTSPNTGTTATTSASNELWVGCINLLYTSQSSPTNSFTLLGGSASFCDIAYLEKIVSSTGTATCTTTTGTANQWCGCIATFMAAGSNVPVTFSAVTCNGTRSGSVARFQTTASSKTGIVGYIFYNSVSGTNSSFISVSGNPSSYLITSTVTMPSSGSVSVEWYTEGAGNTWSNTGLHTFTVFVMSPTVLAADGNVLRTPSGQLVTLKGMDYSYFMDSPYGSWLLPNSDIEWNVWDTTGIADLLTVCQAWNVNVLRCFLTVEWLEPGNANYTLYMNHLHYFADVMGNASIYVDFCWWRCDSGDSEPAGVLPWNDGSSYLTSPTQFVNVWVSFSDSFANNQYVLFELWNEPNSNTAGDEAVWMNTCQHCITEMRGNGTCNPIIVQWEYNVGYGMQWVYQYPLTDPAGNIIYASHIYDSVTDGGFYNFAESAVPCAYSILNGLLTSDGVYAAAANYPVFIGEFGASNWDSTQNATAGRVLVSGTYVYYEQDIYFNNTATLLDQHGISYCCWAGPPWYDYHEYGFLDTYIGTNYPLNNHVLDPSDAQYSNLSTGTILVIDHLGGESYSTWISQHG